jgi:hypothetical protein
MMIPSVTEQEILERVDEYSLYCFYLEFEPIIGCKYNSKLRAGDDYPSFGVYERTSVRRSGGDFINEYMWKDQALPGKNFGDIFDLVKIIYNLPSRFNAIWKVCADFNLGGDYEAQKTLAVVEPVYTPPTRIRIESRAFTTKDLEYWNKYNISQEILEAYSCTAIRCVWFNEFQEIPVMPQQAYAYRIHDRYQIYQPHASKALKFRNDWTELHIPGWFQLQGNELCINTKAFKDVMCLRSFGYDAISPRGENILLPSKAIEVLQRRFKRVVTLFDNDGKHSADSYPFDKIFIPLESKAKDITDYCAMYGREKTAELLKQLLDDTRGR